ncbi:lipid A biosynthesis acyltransferase [Bacteroidia bacterium]|nr:lipid A biosynthesis acyltransferase [Bacteroidia bacterium]
MEKRKWTGKTGGSFLGQWGLIALLKFFDIRVGYALMSIVIPFYMIFSGKHARAIYHYFRRQFHYSRYSSLIWTYKNHFAFGQVILDRFAVYAGKRDIFDVEIVGYEHFLKLADGEKGCIIAGSHIGNFEIGGYFLRSEKKTFKVLVYAGETQTVQNNRAKVLGRNNIHIIPILPDMSHLFAVNVALQNGEIVSMPCDRHLGSAKSVECEFLNGKADFPIGAFALATTLDVEIVSIFVMKTATKKYKLYVRPLTIDTKENDTKSEKIERYVRAYVKEVESIVREYPEQWFNYYEFWKDC